MLMIFMFLLVGGLLGLYTIRWYAPDTQFRTGEMAGAGSCVAAGMALFCGSSIPASLPLGLLLGLLCSCTVTDALRSWLPFPLTVPLLAAGVWYVNFSHPWQFTSGLIWACIWATFYAVRYLLYRLRSEEGADCPGSGDILLAGLAGVCCHAFSGMVVALAITGHQLWGTLRHYHIAPFGPWLSACITIQMLYF